MPGEPAVESDDMVEWHEDFRTKDDGLATLTYLRKLIRHLLTPGVGIDADAIKEMGVVTARAAMTGAFLAAAGRRFRQRPTRSEIRAVIATVRTHYIKDGNPPPMLAEALIRAAVLDDDAVLEGMSREDLNRGQLWLAYGLVHDAGLTGAAYESYLYAAAKTARELLEEMAASE